MNPIYRKRLFITALLAVTLIGCKQENPAATASTTPGAARLSSDDMSFFAKAAQTNMAELAAADIATSRSSDVAVKTYAVRLATDHRLATTSLATLAASKGVSLPTELDADHQKLIQELRTADDFDNHYIDAMESGHEKAVALFDDTANGTKDAEIRAFATATLPTLKQHHEMAEVLDDTDRATSAKP